MKAKILIVDDEPGIVEEVSSFLAEEGYEIQTADTAGDGMRAFEAFKPDLILLDMKLPDQPGMEILKLVKRVSPATKVIVNTGYVDQKMIDEAEALGRDAFLQKPFNLERLLDEVERVLKSLS
ncbi:MAG: response regulator [Candidatus Omnitrophica bacterium]|nr:response regulator [Candidatus Omnitrophota bacterium]